MLTEELVAHFRRPVSVVAATANADLRPEFLRASGIIGAPGDDVVTVYVPEVMAGPTLANLDRDARMAVQVVCWEDFTAVQVKGDVVGSGPADADGDAFVDDNQRRIVEVTTQVVSPEFGAGWGRLVTRPNLALTMRVTELFEQTPGPKAGEKMG